MRKANGAGVRAAAVLGCAGLLAGAGPARADLSAGLVGYYQMGQGAKMNDSSGRFNHGREVNTQRSGDRAGNPNAALSLPGTAGSYARVDNNADLNFGTGDFTLSLWLRYPAQGGGGSLSTASVIFMRSASTASPINGLVAAADGTIGHVTFWVTDGQALTSTASNLNDNTWRHLAFVREHDVLKIYVNGTLDSQKSVPGQDVSVPAGAHLYVGANNGDQKNALNGSMDDLRIYNRALSTSELSTLSKASPVNCVTPTTSALLQAGRFQVTASWSNGGAPAQAFVSCGATTDQTAYFYWTDPGNSELIVKLLDFCSWASTWAVYANGATDMNVVLTITDTVTHATWTRQNPLGQGFQLIRDSAFPCN
jgi:hypothetical protein